ncbi:MAG: acyl-CoA thioesterase domain-containing protein [Actinomycetota bacterium]|nr:thioesterase family protein [Acidimicrobiales bacterium]MED5172614.1 acyl-CoA thioesterase domain-containing protein [Actinomycetota bacterium]
MSDVFKDLMELEVAADGRFMAPPAPEQGQRTFGGQFLAHTLRAAQLTVDEGKFVHSTHSYFLRPGDVDAGTELVVEGIRDGRSFSTREVTAYQEGVERFRTIISFHILEPGLEWTPPTNFDVPGPETTPLSYNEFSESLAPSADGPWHGRQRPMDIRYINPPDLPEGTPITEPQLMWLRINERLDQDRRVHEAALAYLADATLIDHVLLPHGFRWQDARLDGASLDHSMWFHREPVADEWLLYEQRVENTSGARGLGSGRFFNRSGDLVATCVQEGLMRWDNEHP